MRAFYFMVISIIFFVFWYGLVRLVGDLLRVSGIMQ